MKFESLIKTLPFNDGIYHDNRAFLYDTARVGYPDVELQNSIYTELIRDLRLDLDSDSIITLCDFGCGYGDIYPHLIKANDKIIYYGYDIDHELITVGRSLYLNAHLGCMDYMDITFNQDQQFDYSICIGSIHSDHSNKWNRFKLVFEHIISLTKKTACFALMCSDSIEDDLIGFNINDMVEFLGDRYRYSINKRFVDDIYIVTIYL